MKYKALRTKSEPKEFIHIELNKTLGIFEIYTSNIPNLQPTTATIEEMDELFKNDGFDVDLSEFELVEFELVEKNTIGADIRNKLSPPLNLISIIRLYLDEPDTIKKSKLRSFIVKECENAERSIEYISKLL